MKVHIRNVDTHEIVHSIEWAGPPSGRQLERLVSGIMINMRDDCFVDTNEVDAAIAEQERKAKS